MLLMNLTSEDHLYEKYPSRTMRFRCTFSTQALGELRVRVKDHWRPIVRSAVAHSPGDQACRNFILEFFSRSLMENSLVDPRWLESANLALRD